MKTTDLLAQLEQEVTTQNAITSELNAMALELLQKRPGDGKWNALECLEHLNSYARHYLNAFEYSINRSIAKKQSPQTEVKSTWLGRKCISTVLVTTTKKIKAPKRHNHLNKSLNKKVIEEFTQHQQQLQLLLKKGSTIDLNRTKVAIEIMPLLKLNLAEFFQFFIYHQTRHLIQAKKAVL